METMSPTLDYIDSCEITYWESYEELGSVVRDKEVWI